MISFLHIFIWDNSVKKGQNEDDLVLVLMLGYDIFTEMVVIGHCWDGDEPIEWEKGTGFSPYRVLKYVSNSKSTFEIEIE